MSDMPPLFEAILQADHARIRRLVNEGASLTELWNGQMAALSFAVSVWRESDTEELKIEVCRTLLELGAPINLPNVVGATALDDATMAGKKRLASFLMGQGGSNPMTPFGLSNDEVNTIVDGMRDGPSPRADLGKALAWCAGLLAVSIVGIAVSWQSGPIWPGSVAMATLLAAWLTHFKVIITTGEVSPQVPWLRGISPTVVTVLMGLTLIPAAMPLGLLIGFAAFLSAGQEAPPHSARAQQPAAPAPGTGGGGGGGLILSLLVALAIVAALWFGLSKSGILKTLTNPTAAHTPVATSPPKSGADYLASAQAAFSAENYIESAARAEQAVLSLKTENAEPADLLTARELQARSCYKAKQYEVACRLYTALAKENPENKQFRKTLQGVKKEYWSRELAPELTRAKRLMSSKSHKAARKKIIAVRTKSKEYGFDTKPADDLLKRLEKNRN